MDGTDGEMNTFNHADKFSLFCDTIVYPSLGITGIEHITDKEKQETCGDKIIKFKNKNY